MKTTYTERELIGRKWSETLIKDLLVQPDEVNYSRGIECGYLKTRVHRAEKSRAFRKGRTTASKNEERARLDKDLLILLDSITSKYDHRSLEVAAIEDLIDTSSVGDGFLECDMTSSEILDMLCVQFLLHKCQYSLDDNLAAHLVNQSACVTIAVLYRIGFVYPHLMGECWQQSRELRGMAAYDDDLLRLLS